MKKFDELRVVDLRAELERRGLDKSGVKAALIDRLRKAASEEEVNLEEAGLDSPASVTIVDENDSNSDVNKPELDESDVPDAELSAMPESLELHEVLEENGQENSTEIGEDEKLEEIPAATSPVLEKELTEDSVENTVENVISESEPTDCTVNGSVEEEGKKIASEEEPTIQEDTVEQVEEDIMGDINMQDDSIDLLLEDEDKILDYEENYRMDMDDNTEERVSDKDSVAKKDQDKEENNSSEVKEDPKEKDEEKSTCNLWVSGLRQSTKAQDLRTIFLKHGKVLSVKIVTNAKSTTGRCFGFITMASKEAAENCICNLHQTEINGRIILVELAKGDLGGASKVATKNDKDRSAVASNEHSKRNVEKRKDAHPEKSEGSKNKDRSRSKSRNRVSAKDRVVDRRQNKNKDGYRSRSPRKNVLNLRKIETERVKQRQRTHERLMREEERRRRDEDVIRKSFERQQIRRQNDESLKIQREREKLRVEREKLERDKQELLRIEREQQKLERDRIQREREEIHRQALKYEEVRRGLKRPSGDRDRDREYFDQRKRPAPDNRSRFEPAPNSSHRFERHGREVESRSVGSHFEDRRDRRRSDDRSHREQVDIRGSTHQSFRDRSSRDSRYSSTSMSQPNVEAWRPSGTSTKGQYGGNSATIPNQVSGVGRTGSESQSGWRSSNNLGGDRWASSSTGTSRSGQTLLEMMHRGGDHHVSQVPSSQTLPMMSTLQQNNRFSSINYRNY